jgi:hypothetical protein
MSHAPVAGRTPRFPKPQLSRAIRIAFNGHVGTVPVSSFDDRKVRYVFGILEGNLLVAYGGDV